MVKIERARVKELIGKFRGRRILVIGDLMLDRYLTGRVSRLSPEAPVPIVEIEEEFSRLGGAANVGNNIKALGGIPFLVGIIGEDNSGRELLKLFKDVQFPTDGIVIDHKRPTTVKTRVIAHTQHVVRTDRELCTEIDAQLEKRIMEIVDHLMPDMDAVILQDYNKGLLTRNVIEYVISSANAQNKIITVDPKFDHFFDYRNVTVFKPNRREAAEALGMRLDSRQQVIEAARKLFERLNCQCLMITLGEDGMALFNHKQDVRFIPTRARKVHDVSGAGDTVISTVTMALISGCHFDEAATLGNVAAGIVCEEVGIVPITPERLLEFAL